MFLFKLIENRCQCIPNKIQFCLTEKNPMSTEQAINDIFSIINRCEGDRNENLKKAIQAAITYLTQHELPIPNLQLYASEQNE